MGSSWAGTALLVAGLLVCPVLLSSPDIFQHLMAPLTWLGDSEYLLICPLVMGGLLLTASAWMRRWEALRKLRGKVSIAFQLHNFQSVLELEKSAPAAVAKDPWLRYHMAFGAPSAATGPPRSPSSRSLCVTLLVYRWPE